MVGFEGEGDLELVGGEGQIHGGLWIGEAWGRAEGELEEIGHSIQIGVGGGSLFGWREAAAADPAGKTGRRWDGQAWAGRAGDPVGGFIAVLILRDFEQRLP